ncbi:MAG: hypothetical protein ABJC10_10940 [Acidobacteriota bacterium]
MTNPLPAGWHSVTPRIVVHNPTMLVEFLKHAFCATGEFHEDRPALIRIGHSLIMDTPYGERRGMVKDQWETFGRSQLQKHPDCDASR